MKPILVKTGEDLRLHETHSAEQTMREIGKKMGG
jgi:hypothetical protein